mgnify:CR=1 FL=1
MPRRPQPRIFKIIKLIFLITFMPISADIDLTTIDSFRINNLGSHSLMVSKESDTPDSNAGFFFIMDRPHCICERVTFVLHTPESNGFIRPEEDTSTIGTMRVDFKKAQEIEFEVFLARPNKKTNLIQPQNFPSIREAKFIEIKTVYGKERFILSGFKDVMRQATEMCKSFIPYLEEEVESQDMKT